MFRAVAKAADRWPWLVVLLTTVTAALLNSDLAMGATDWNIFAGPGRGFWIGDAGALLSDPVVQAGPLTLIGVGLIDILIQVDEPWHNALSVIVCCTLSCAGLIILVRVVTRGAGALQRGALVIGAVGLAVTWTFLRGNNGHPTHVLLPILWFLAARALQRGMGGRAGCYLGIALGLDTWGIFGAGLVLASDRPRTGLRACAAGVGVAALCWVPFALSGPVRSFDLAWAASPGSLPGLLFEDVTVPWSYRLWQGLLCVIVGALAAIWLRRSPDLCWVFPLVVVGARLVTDPIFFAYYRTPLQLMALVGTCALISRRDKRWIWAALTCYLAALTIPAGLFISQAPVMICIVVLAWVLRSQPPHGPAQAADTIPPGVAGTYRPVAPGGLSSLR